jgi:hypothetical protein
VSAGITVALRVGMGAEDAHHGGGLVAGARVLELSGDRCDLSPSAADILAEPVVVRRAVGATVVPRTHSRAARADQE